MSQDDNFSTSTPSLEGQEDYLPQLVDDPHLDENQHPPDGITLPLNSKKLVISQLRRLATTLEISAVGSAATLRQVIEGKLIQLGHEPRNIQVVVSNVDSSL